MNIFLDNIEDLTEENNYFRKVLATTQHTQLVVMSLKPNESIGKEVHPVTDQFIRIEDGHGKIIINGEEKEIDEDDAFIIPAGAEHDVVNTSSEDPLKLYTLYSPPHHEDGTIHKTKEDAQAGEADHS